MPGRWGEEGGEKMRLARGDGVAIFRRDTISYEIREIKSGDVEKRGISGSCGARSRPLFCPRRSIVVSGQPGEIGMQAGHAYDEPSSRGSR